MSAPDPEVDRILQQFSRLFSKPLQLNTPGPDSGETRTDAGRRQGQFSVATANGETLGPEEQEILREVCRLLEVQAQTRTALQNLEERFGLLEHQNADLMVSNQGLAQCSSRDLLTGLFSRSYAMDKLEEEMNRSWRFGSPMSIMLIDLDHLKRINEHFGAAVGDQVLKHVGSILKNSCRVYDVPARFAGEEFCLLLPHTPLNRTRTVAERIRRGIESRPVFSGTTPVYITASIGVSGLESVPEEALFSTSSLLQRADQALEAAKSKGRNCVVTWSPSIASAPIVLDH
ncbi:MAG: GGDEF domain-containing protein [Acidobacteriota bacterium]